MAVMNFSPRRGLKKKKRKKRWRFLWDRHSNNYSYPSYEEWYTFNWGKFAALMVMFLMVFFVAYILLDLFVI